MFIPPTALYFRLIDSAGLALYSQNGQTPEVWHVEGPKADDQQFSLVYGTGAHEGMYAILGKASGKVLFSLPFSTRGDRIGHVAQDAQNNYTWFQFPQAPGASAGTFRILCPRSQMVWVSRTHAAPNVTNHPASEVYGDQFFTFAFDDMVVKKIEYNVAQGKIVESSTVTLSDQTLNNTANTDQELSFTFSECVMHTSAFEYSNGFPVAAGTELQTGIPFVSQGDVKVDGAVTNTWNFGSEKSFPKTFAANFHIKAGPGQSVHAVSTVQCGMLEVPYAITLVQSTSGVEVQMTGTWKGISTWNLRHQIDVV